MDNPDSEMEADEPVTDSDSLLPLAVAMDLPVTASLGPVGPLLRQLHSRPEVEIQSLTKDLDALCISLMDHSEAEEPSSTAKRWMSEVRELCYDTKNYLDEIHSKPKLEVMVLEARAKHASERRQRNEIDRQSIKKAKFLPNGRRRLPILHPELIDRGRTDKLATLLRNEEDKQLKVVSLLGLEGVGKTTLAKKLYHQLTVGEFQCGAFLRVSPKPDMRRLLTSLFTQVRRQQPSCSLDAEDLITSIFNSLRVKRFLIIIDDIWSTSVWDIISRAFPDDGLGSRIITTTQFEDVASACSSYQPEYIFEMEPLEVYQSERLFFGMVFGSKDNDSSCPQAFASVSVEISRKCSGLPLLTVNVASLLPTPSEITNLQQWEDIRDSLPPTLRRSPSSEGIKEVVNLIYSNLSPELKTCLLYLAMYPEGYTVDKDDLVKQWVAEGFTGEGQNKEEIARECFDELVSRGTVQAVGINYRGVLSCTLHHMVHDLIVRKSMEENFIITVDNFKSPIGLLEKVRRLSVQCGGARRARIPDSIVVSEVRSLAFFGYCGCTDFIDEYKFLRVLTLHVWSDEETAYDLSGILKLLQLRYLKIQCNIDIKLRDEIQALQYLETLEVDAIVFAIPLGFGLLSRLSSLKIAVRELSTQDICILEQLPALSALSLHVCAEPVEMIFFDKGGFSVLKYFIFRCSVPLLKFEAGSMPDLQLLNLCFNAYETDQYGTATISIEHLPGLKEITAEIWGADTFRTAISNHPRNPRIHVQLVDCIFPGEDKKKNAAHSSLPTSTFLPPKMMSTLLGSFSLLPVQGAAKKPKLKILTNSIEVKVHKSAYGPEDMSNRISKLKIKMDDIDDDKLENFDNPEDMDVQLSMPSSPMNKRTDINWHPGWAEKNRQADIRIYTSPGSSSSVSDSGYREDRPGMRRIPTESVRSTDVHTGQQTQGPASLPTMLQLEESVASTSVFEHGISSAKVCSYLGCGKGSRGSSGRCVRHGGGRRCQKEGCSKGSEGRTSFCKAHGGGRRCEHLGCTKRAEGRTDHCIAHGGGERCTHEGCRKAARRKSDLCIRHGGGKRCHMENCQKSAEGKSGLCLAHGGGRRCEHADCSKRSHGSTGFCKSHGCGNRCTHPSCTKGAKGSTQFCKGHGGGKRCSAQGCTKSVHGGTKYCVAHGGGKRCVVEECTKSARGRTDCCVGHGGGKRCMNSGCDKSAQGSTDFCKAHGGGKRCSWSDAAVDGSPCDRLARGKNGMCIHHNQLLVAPTPRSCSITSTVIDSGDHHSKTETMEAPPCHEPQGRVHGGNNVSVFATGISSGELSPTTRRLLPEVTIFTDKDDDKDTTRL